TPSTCATRSRRRWHSTRGMRASPSPAAPGSPLPTRSESEDRRAEGARDEVDGEARSRVLAVENRVHLDDLEGACEPRAGDELEREMRLAVGQPAPHGCAHTRCDLGVERVHVERDVDEAGAGHSVERLLDHPLDASAVDLAHRKHSHLALVEELALGRLARSDTDTGDPCRIGWRR